MVVALICDTVLNEFLTFCTVLKLNQTSISSMKTWQFKSFRADGGVVSKQRTFQRLTPPSLSWFLV